MVNHEHIHRLVQPAGVLGMLPLDILNLLQHLLGTSCAQQMPEPTIAVLVIHEEARKGICGCRSRSTLHHHLNRRLFQQIVHQEGTDLIFLKLLLLTNFIELPCR